MKKLRFKEDKLNLGCGQYNKKGYLNVDFDPSTKPDLFMDLDNLPYLFIDNQFSLIEADHVLEHLSNPFAIMKELHRILKPGGKLIIRVPHFSRGFSHPDHKRGYDVSFPLYFNKNFKGGYTGTEFKIGLIKLNWFSQPYLKKITLTKFQYAAGIFFGKIFNSLAKLSPYTCSRIWCYLVGGFEEIEFHFIK